MNKLPLPLLTGLIAAAIEYPISRRYSTVPPTDSLIRMMIAGVIAGGSVYLAQRIQERRLITYATETPRIIEAEIIPAPR